MRTFKHFPEDDTCPLCGTSEDKEAALVPVDDTTINGLCDGKPMHIECIQELDCIRYNRDVLVIYREVLYDKKAKQE